MSVATEPINTKRVKGRRTVRYDSLSDVMDDAERLAHADVRLLGNWSQGQIFRHLAQAFDLSIDGGKMLPAPVRLILNLFMKSKLLNQGLPAGFKAPSNFVPPETSTEEGLALLRVAVARQDAVSERAPHPGFGKFTRSEWNQFHLRHAEMHMSFIVKNT